MKKILYVITKLELGGAQTQLLELIKGLDKEKFSPILFSAAEGLLVEEAKAIPGLKLHLSPNLERPINILKDMFCVFEIINYIKENNVDIVHTHSSKAGIIGRLAAKLAKAKMVVHTVHGWSFNKYQLWAVREFYIILERICASFTDKIIVVSCFDHEAGIKNKIGIRKKYERIAYGIDYTRFKPQYNYEKSGEAFGLKQDKLKVGMIACLKPQKSPLDFISLAKMVCQKVDNVQFELVGDGVLRKKAERLIQRYSLDGRVRLLGWRKDIPELLVSWDVVVLTSLWEGLPVSILEAMAAAKPVVVTDTGGVRELIIDGQNGFLVGCKDVYAASKKVCFLLQDERLRLSMGQMARGLLRDDYTFQKMLDKTQMLYK